MQAAMRQNTRTSASTVANTLALLAWGTIAGTGSASGVGYQAGQIAAQDLLGGIAVPRRYHQARLHR